MRRTIFITSIVCLATFGLVLNGCVKEKSDQLNPAVKTNPIDIQRISDCHKKNNPYPSQINANLEGNWVWVSKSCPMQGNKTTSADKYVIVKFTDRALYQLFEDGRMVSEGTFSLSSSTDGNWEITTTKSTNYLHGDILLCDNELVLYSSYRDGCDLYFQKK